MPGAARSTPARPPEERRPVEVDHPSAFVIVPRGVANIVGVDLVTTRVESLLTHDGTVGRG